MRCSPTDPGCRYRQGVTCRTVRGCTRLGCGCYRSATPTLLRGNLRHRRKRASGGGWVWAAGNGSAGEKGGGNPVGDGDQVVLQEIEKFVQPAGQDLLDRSLFENRAQSVEPFRDVVASAQAVMVLQLGERVGGFA